MENITEQIFSYKQNNQTVLLIIDICTVLSIIQAIVCLFGSLLIIISICRFSYLQNTTNIFIFNLDVADLIVGPVQSAVNESVTLLKHLSLSSTNFSSWKYACKASYVIGFFSGFVEYLTLLFIPTK